MTDTTRKLILGSVLVAIGIGVAMVWFGVFTEVVKDSKTDYRSQLAQPPELSTPEGLQH